MGRSSRRAGAMPWAAKAAGTWALGPPGMRMQEAGGG